MTTAQNTSWLSFWLYKS